MLDTKQQQRNILLCKSLEPFSRFESRFSRFHEHASWIELLPIDIIVSFLQSFYNTSVQCTTWWSVDEHRCVGSLIAVIVNFLKQCSLFFRNNASCSEQYSLFFQSSVRYSFRAVFVALLKKLCGSSQFYLESHYFVMEVVWIPQLIFHNLAILDNQLHLPCLPLKLLLHV